MHRCIGKGEEKPVLSAFLSVYDGGESRILDEREKDPLRENGLGVPQSFRTHNNQLKRYRCRWLLTPKPLHSHPSDSLPAGKLSKARLSEWECTVTDTDLWELGVIYHGYCATQVEAIVKTDRVTPTARTAFTYYAVYDIISTDILRI